MHPTSSLNVHVSIHPRPQKNVVIQPRSLTPLYPSKLVPERPFIHLISSIWTSNLVPEFPCIHPSSSPNIHLFNQPRPWDSIYSSIHVSKPSIHVTSSPTFHIHPASSHNVDVFIHLRPRTSKYSISFPCVYLSIQPSILVTKLSFIHTFSSPNVHLSNLRLHQTFYQLAFVFAVRTKNLCTFFGSNVSLN